MNHLCNPKSSRLAYESDNIAYMPQKISPFRYVLPITFFVFFSFVLYSFFSVTLWEFPLLRKTASSDLTALPKFQAYQDVYPTTDIPSTSQQEPLNQQGTTQTTLTPQSVSAFFQKSVAQVSGSAEQPTSPQALQLSGRQMQITLTDDQVQKVIDTFLPTISQTVPIKSFTIDFEGSTFKTDIQVDLSFFKGAVSGNGRVVNNRFVLDDAVFGIVPLSAANREYVSTELNNAIYSAAEQYRVSITSLSLVDSKIIVVLTNK